MTFYYVNQHQSNWENNLTWQNTATLDKKYILQVIYNLPILHTLSVFYSVYLKSTLYCSELIKFISIKLKTSKMKVILNMKDLHAIMKLLKKKKKKLTSLQILNCCKCLYKLYRGCCSVTNDCIYTCNYNYYRYIFLLLNVFIEQLCCFEKFVHWFTRMKYI